MYINTQGAVGEYMCVKRRVVVGGGGGGGWGGGGGGQYMCDGRRGLPKNTLRELNKHNPPPPPPPLLSFESTEVEEGCGGCCK